MLKRMSPKRRARLERAGTLDPASTFARGLPERRDGSPRLSAPVEQGASAAGAVSPDVVTRPGRAALRATQRRRDTGPDRKTRAAVIIRDGYRCARCGQACGPGTSAPYSIQHRKARGVGGGNEMSNLILLCGTGTTGCHGQCELRRGAEAWGGYWLPSYVDPRSYPVLYFDAADDEGGWFRYLHDDGSLSDRPEQ